LTPPDAKRNTVHSAREGPGAHGSFLHILTGASFREGAPGSHAGMARVGRRL